MIKKIFLLTFIISTMLFLNCSAQIKQVIALEIDEFDNYYAINFPAGTYFSIILEEPIDTGINKEDDICKARVDTTTYLGKLVVVPKGSRVIGKITHLERAHMGRNALINIRFYTIIPGNSNDAIAINAFINDKNPDGSIGGGLTQKSEIKKIVHNIEGIGAVVQALSTGPRVMGQEIYIPAGERWTIQLTEPVTAIIPK